MATVSDLVEFEGQHVARKTERNPKGRGRQDKSVAQEPLVTFEKRLVRVELTVADHNNRWEELDQRMV
jgi:hypothetical protein